MSNELPEINNSQESPDFWPSKLDQLKSKADNLIAKINSDAFLTPAEKQAKRDIIETKLKQITKEMNKSKSEAETDDLFSDVNSQIDNLEKEFDQAYEEKTRPTEKNGDKKEQRKKDAESGGEENPEVKIDARLKDKIDILKSKGKVVSELNRNKNLTDQDKSKLSSVYQKANDYYAAHLRELDNPQVVDEMMMLLDNYEQALDKITKLNEKINQRGIIPEAAEGTSDKIAPEDEISWEDAEEELQKQREEFQAKERVSKTEKPDEISWEDAEKELQQQREMIQRKEQKKEEAEQRNFERELGGAVLRFAGLDDAQIREELERAARYDAQVRKELEKENTDLKEKLRLATGKAEKMENDLQKLRENADKYMELAEKAKNQPDVQGKKLERPIGEIIDQKKLEKLVTLAQVFWREMEAEAGNSAYINKYGPDKPLLFRIEARSYIRDLITEKRLISNSEDLETVVGYVLDKVKPE